MTASFRLVNLVPLVFRRHKPEDRATVGPWVPCHVEARVG
jgi:hypothetical protein